MTSSQNLPPDERGILFRKETSAGILVHTDGFGLHFQKGRHLTGSLKGIMEAELVTMKHPKEISMVNPYSPDAKKFIYGKLNSFLILRPGIGLQRVVNHKQNSEGVEIRTHLMAGLSLGILKPVYLLIYNYSKDGNDSITTEKYNPSTHYIDRIYGRASFFKGIGETKLQTGIYGKFSVSFEYSGYRDQIRSLETGITLDAYKKRVPIMADFNVTKEPINKNTFLCFYLLISWGVKKN